MTSRLYKGSTIQGLANRGQQLTRDISAHEAVSAIMNKFGVFDKNAEYYHRANGVWSKHDPHLDSQINAKGKGKRFTLSKEHKGDSGKKGYL